MRGIKFSGIFENKKTPLYCFLQIVLILSRGATFRDILALDIEVSSSSYRAGSTDIPDLLSPLLPIVHRPR